MGKKKLRRFAGRYDVLRPLGEGTTGTVYLATDTSDGQQVALKIPREDLGLELDIVRFHREYEVLSQIEHPGIVKIREIGPNYVTMDFLPGETLGALVGEEVTYVLEAAIELAEILACLHGHGLIHRRFHPSNVRFDDGNRLVALDFGFPFAGDTRGPLETEETSGAIEYMAPERIRGFELDPRADIYSFGVLLYEMVTGKRPHSMREMRRLGTRVLETAPTPPSRHNKDVTPGYEKIILTCLARDPSDRYQSAEELLNELVFLSGKSEIARIRTERGRQFLFPPRFVGQDATLAGIEEAHAAARAGRGRCVVVHGRAGLGKSRILRESRARCLDEDAIVLEVDCEAASEGALAPLAVMVRQLVAFAEKRRPHRMGELAGRWGPLLIARIPDLAKKSYLQALAPAIGVPDPLAAKEFLLLVLELVEKGTLLVLADNLHAAHEVVGQFLYDLLTHGRDKRVLVLATRRVGGEDDSESGADRLLPRLRSEGLVTEYELDPLSSGDLATFLGSMIGKKRLDGLLVERIEEVTGGVPRLAEETMGTLADEGLLFRRGGVWQIEIDDYRRIQRPRLVEDAMVERVGQLSAREQLIFTTACLLGERIELPIVAELSRVQGTELENALDTLVELGLLERPAGHDEAAYAVASREARRKILDELDPKTRARMHDEAAAVLERTGRDQTDEELEALAHHLENGRTPADAIKYLVRAADRARRLFAADRAIALFERALALTDPEKDGRRRAEILGKLGSVFSRSGQFDHAIRHYTQAINLARGDSRGAAFYLLGLGYAYYRKNKYNDALHCFNQLLGLFGDNGVRPEVLAHISRTYLAKGNLAKSEEVCREALDLARGGEKGRVEASIRNQMGEIQYMQGLWDQSLESQEAALELLPEEGEYFLKSRVNDGIARIHLGKGDRERSYKYLEDALYQAQFSGDHAYVVEVTNHIGEIFERTGDLDRAQEIYLDSIKTAERLDQDQVVALGCLNLGRLLVRRGRVSESIDQLTRARRLFRDCRLPWGVGASYLHLGDAFLADERFDKAKTSYALAERSLRDVQMKWMVGHVYCGVVEIFVRQLDLETALKTLNRALNLAREYQDRVLLGRVHREYARFCAASDHREVAIEHFVRSHIVLEDAGARFELARTHYEYGRYLLESERSGDRGHLKSAVNHLRKARDLLEHAGETVWLDRAQQLLKECDRERISVHQRTDLGRGATHLLSEFDGLEELGRKAFEKIAAEIAAELGGEMDRDQVLQEVDKRIAKAESSLQKRLKDLRGKHERLLEEIEDLREERNALWNLQQIAGEINAVHDSEKVFAMSTSMMVKVVRADRATLVLKGEGGALQFQLGMGIEREAFEGPEYEAARAIVRRVLQTGEPTITTTGQGEDRLAGAERSGGGRGILCTPLTIRENPIGALYAESAPGAHFTDRDVDLLGGFANQVAVALENAFLYEELNEKQRLEQELNIANRIQAKLLPKTIPQVQGIEVYGKMIPAGKVGGDYYDFITDDKARNMILCIGDVSGKGIPGGLVMVMARVLLHHFDVADQSTREILLRANEILKANTEPFIFMSMLLLKWESELQRLTYTGAGHENLLIYRAKDQEVEVVPAGGIVLGIKDNLDNYLTEKDIQLDHGDAILLYTDGVTEAQNVRGEMFELENLTRSFGRHAGKDVAEVCEGVIGDVRKFIGGAEQHDDITITVLKRAF